MVFGVENRPGEKVSRLIELTVGGEKISFPLFTIHGKKDGPTLAITAGIHGTEYASIEAALRLGRTLDPEEVYGKVIILPISNMPSFRKRTIYVGPLDHKNLNRVFPGKQEGSFSEALAYHLFHEVIKKGDFYIDLHGGDMIEALVPFVIYAPSGNSEVDKVSLSMAESFGLELVVKSEPKGSAISAASESGTPAILAEAGGQGIWGEETVTIHMTGVKRVMGQLKMMKEKPDVRPIKVFPFPWLFSEYEGLFYPQVGIGEKISAGQKLGSVCDYFGRELQSAVSPTDGTVLFLVTSLAINKGDPLLGIGG
jgi:predicted deacylase